MKDLGEDLSFFDDHCHKRSGKFINILIAINHIMLYTKRSDYQPIRASIVGSRNKLKKSHEGVIIIGRFAHPAGN